MSIPSFPTINHPRIQAALAEVADWERGTVVNDHYSPDFYTERRARFLGRHPDYAHINNGLFSDVCEDADLVFGTYENDLSVQEVRRRELANEIIPFLPLPTTCNTETIDSFAELPDSEWAEGKQGVWPVFTPTPSPPPAPVRLTDDVPSLHTMNGVTTASDAGVDQRRQQADNDSISPVKTSNEGAQLAQQMAMAGAQGGNTARQPLGPGDVNNVSRIVGELNRLYPQNGNNASGMRIQPADTGPAAIAQSQGAIRAPPRIARETAPSYANRPTNRRVKVRRGTKRPMSDIDEGVEYVSTDSEAGNDSAASEVEALPAPRPKKSLKLNAGPRPTGATKQTVRPVDSRASSEVQEVAPLKAAAPKKTTQKQKQTQMTTTAFTKSGPTLEAVVSGAALPRSRAQATEADGARYDLLRNQHNARLRARKKKAQDSPELMPEYFQAEKFPAKAKDDQVRCVCGIVVDDGGRMVCCDVEQCGVWQHVACVGEAAPEDLEEGSYRCHNCDPWRHRRVVQGLRRGNVVQGQN